LYLCTEITGTSLNPIYGMSMDPLYGGAVSSGLVTLISVHCAWKVFRYFVFTVIYTLGGP